MSVKFRSWIDDLLKTSWEACQGTDLLIESPSAMGGIHIAEALEIPYFRAFTMTWTRTRAYPHAFGVPDRKVGGSRVQNRLVVLSVIFCAPQMGGNYNYLVRISCIVMSFGLMRFTLPLVVLRTLRPGLLERYCRPGQQMAALRFGTPKHKLG